MRVMALATAALSALYLATAPAAAQIRAESLAAACPNLTLNQIGTKLAALVEQYEFSSNADEALEQAADLLCPDPAQTAQAPEPQDLGVQQTGVPLFGVMPSPQGRRPPPHSQPFALPTFNPCATRFPGAVIPVHCRNGRRVRPPRRHAHRPSPPYGYGMPRGPVIGGYRGPAPQASQPQPYKTEQGEPVCNPIPAPFPGCVLVDTPGRNCANKSWKCKRNQG